MGKKYALLLLTLVLVMGAIVLLATAGSMKALEETVLEPGERVEWMKAELKNPGQSHELPIYYPETLTGYLSQCVMTPVERIRGAYETGETVLEISMEVDGVQGLVTILLGEKDLVSREGVLYELKEGDDAQADIEDHLCRQTLMSFVEYTEIRAMVNNDLWSAPESVVQRSLEEAVGLRRWRAENFFEQCANAPFAVVVLTNEAGHELWIQEDMDMLLLDDGSGMNIWLDGGADDGEILNEIWAWARQEAGEE